MVPGPQPVKSMYTVDTIIIISATLNNVRILRGLETACECGGCAKIFLHTPYSSLVAFLEPWLSIWKYMVHDSSYTCNGTHMSTVWNPKTKL